MLLFLQQMAITVLIYEDNARLRSSLELLLNGEQDLAVLGAYASCENALRQVDQLNPNVIIMDINMPGTSGIEGTRLIKAAFPDVRILMHTVFDDDNAIYNAIAAGADGYLLKNTAPDKLLAAIKEVMNGSAAMSPYVAQRVFNHFRENVAALPQFDLSAREKEILELLVKGNSYKMIAGACNITIDTVKKHLQNIYHKLHVSCGTEAVAAALRHRIVNI